MSANHSSNGDYKSLNASGKGKTVEPAGDLKPLRPGKKTDENETENSGLVNFARADSNPSRERLAGKELPSEEAFGLQPRKTGQTKDDASYDDREPFDESDNPEAPKDHFEEQRELKRVRKADRDFEISEQRFMDSKKRTLPDLYRSLLLYGTCAVSPV